jgi:hypothetical protein
MWSISLTNSTRNANLDQLGQALGAQVAGSLRPEFAYPGMVDNRALHKFIVLLVSVIFRVKHCLKTVNCFRNLVFNFLNTPAAARTPAITLLAPK